MPRTILPASVACVCLSLLLSCATLAPPERARGEGALWAEGRALVAPWEAAGPARLEARRRATLAARRALWDKISPRNGGGGLSVGQRALLDPAFASRLRGLIATAPLDRPQVDDQGYMTLQVHLEPAALAKIVEEHQGT